MLGGQPRHAAIVQATAATAVAEAANASAAEAETARAGAATEAVQAAETAEQDLRSEQDAHQATRAKLQEQETAIQTQTAASTPKLRPARRPPSHSAERDHPQVFAGLANGNHVIMIDMIAKAWFNNALDLVPGREIYRSDRTFQLSAYTARHSQLLLRSDAQFTDEDEEPGTTIELLFKPVEAVDLRSVHYSGLTVRCATPEEAERIKTSRTSTDPDDEYVFMLESQGQIGHIVAMSFGWHEDVLPPVLYSFFNQPYPSPPTWPTAPLFGDGSGFNLASVEDLQKALSTDPDGDRTRREKFRLVHVLMVRMEGKYRSEAIGSGVFLTKADAESARALMAPKVLDCWIETLPIAM